MIIYPNAYSYIPKIALHYTGRLHSHSQLALDLFFYSHSEGIPGAIVPFYHYCHDADNAALAVGLGCASIQCASIHGMYNGYMHGSNSKTTLSKRITLSLIPCSSCSADYI